eukprot:7120508-Prymnesium_polylepis.1
MPRKPRAVWNHSTHADDAIEQSSGEKTEGKTVPRHPSRGTKSRLSTRELASVGATTLLSTERAGWPMRDPPASETGVTVLRSPFAAAPTVAARWHSRRLAVSRFDATGHSTTAWTPPRTVNAAADWTSRHAASFLPIAMPVSCRPVHALCTALLWASGVWLGAWRWFCGSRKRRSLPMRVVLQCNTHTHA